MDASAVLGIVLLAAAVVLVGIGGLMAALDAALSVTSRSDLVEWSEQGRNRRALQAISQDIDSHANAVTFIRILSETAAAVLVTSGFLLMLDSVLWTIVVTIVAMTLISFVLVGASPRSVGRQHATGLLTSAAPVVRGVRLVLGPVASGLSTLGSRLTPGVTRGTTFTSEDQLLSMVDEAASQSLIEEDDRELIHSVFDFTDRFVRAVMVPRTDLITLDSDATAREAMDLLLRSGVSRVPLEHEDDVAGVLYLKDLVRFAYGEDASEDWADQPALPIARPAVFVPESMKAETLLQQMKRDFVHVCMVVDEYGSISGLVTLEDLIEELVGDISDEYDSKVSEVIDLGDGRFRVSARLPLDEAGELFDIEVEDDDVDSIGGLLGKLLGAIPEPGSTATAFGIIITGDQGRGRHRGLATVVLQRAPLHDDETEDDIAHRRDDERNDRDG